MCSIITCFVVIISSYLVVVVTSNRNLEVNTRGIIIEELSLKYDEVCNERDSLKKELCGKVK